MKIDEEERRKIRKIGVCTSVNTRRKGQQKRRSPEGEGEGEEGKKGFQNRSSMKVGEGGGGGVGARKMIMMKAETGMGRESGAQQL